MRIEDLNPIVPPQQVAGQVEARAARRPESSVDQDVFSPTGQITLNGFTAYFSVKNGEEIVFQLVEDATGRVIRQLSPAESLHISGAISQMLAEKPSDTLSKEAKK